MKLLFDQNLSFKLCQAFPDLFPESRHVRLLGLSEVGDRVLWDYAKENGFTIVSQDADFAEMAVLLRPPPKVI
jgi:predicted nuclease of predicted toxin-antitoxin system